MASVKPPEHPRSRAVFVAMLAAWIGAAVVVYRFGVPFWPRTGSVPGTVLVAVLSAFVVHAVVTRKAPLFLARPSRVPAARLMLVAALLSMQGAAEEILFRGFLFHQLEGFSGSAIAWLISTLSFSAAHYPGQKLTGVYVHALTGALFGFLFWRSGGTLAPALAHATYNVLTLLERSRVHEEPTAAVASAAALEKEKQYVQDTH